MKILVVGGGGREHALAWKLRQSPRVAAVFAAPGNAGIAQQAECVDLRAEDVAGLADFAQRNGIDLTLVGPEAPLTLGIVDAFARRGLRIVGPTRAAAALEGSKVFAKDFMRRHGIPTARHETFDDLAAARRHVRAVGAPVVVKADGLAAGKGVIVCRTVDEALGAVDLIMRSRAFGDAGNRVVVEEFLEGEEASVLAFTDAQSVVPLPPAQDHKPVFDGDRGPNTGGMGAYSPAPVVTEAVQQKVMERILVPAVRGMAAEGHPYRGVLYAGLMIRDGEPYNLEFNARLGDPETEVQLVRMASDLVPVLEGIVDGRLHEADIAWRPEPAVCVVMASAGYPGDYAKGKPITGLDDVARMRDTVVFHAGTARRDGRVVTNGGRVLVVTAWGPDHRAAIDRAYGAVQTIHWDGAHFRADIGHKALHRA